MPKCRQPSNNQNRQPVSRGPDRSAAIAHGRRFGQRILTALQRTLRLAVLAPVVVSAASAQQARDMACAPHPPVLCALPADQARFLYLGQLAARRYHQPEAAVADGFQPLGADAPAMGRHWLQLVRLSDGIIDPERPELLMYAEVGGRDSLVGFGFGFAFGPGGSPAPPGNPFPAEAWHSHSGRLDVESHRIDHEGSGMHKANLAAHEPGSAAGVSFLHAWVRPGNPAGVLEPNNWALPYLRLGLDRPAAATAGADLAISLLSVGADFFITRAGLFPELGPGPAGGWAETLGRAEIEVRGWWRSREEGPLTTPEVHWLGQLWKRYGLNGL